MKTFAVYFFTIVLCANIQLHAQSDSVRIEGGLTWYTDILQANEISQKTNKPLFAFFTGSDWCGWCKKLQKDVFSKPEFVAWADKNVVLLELDFPRRKVLDPKLAQQNASLQRTFQVQGYPTIWIFFLNKNVDSMKYEIQALGSVGYPQGAEIGKEEVKFLNDANSILKNKVVK
jgi:protein disulfide-isomerase